MARLGMLLAGVISAIAWVWIVAITFEVVREEQTSFQSLWQGVPVLAIAIIATAVAMGSALQTSRRSERIFLGGYWIASAVLWGAALTLGLVTSRIVY